jgi:methylglyoxal synthase
MDNRGRGTRAEYWRYRKEEELARAEESAKTIALIAHDNKKQDLCDWARDHRDTLARYRLCGTGSTAKLVSSDLELDVAALQHGPLGGDVQIGAMIVDGLIDAVVFFWDPLEPQPHDPDVKALIRLATVWDVPTACNRSTADAVLLSLEAEAGRNRGWSFETEVA